MNYLMWVVLPNLNVLFTLFGVLGMIIWVLIFLFIVADKICNNQEIKPETHRVMKKTGIMFGALLTLACLTPDKEQLQALVLIDTISHVKNIKELPDNTVELLNVFVKSQISKLKDDKS